MNISNFPFEIIRLTFKMFTEILSILRLYNAPNIITIVQSKFNEIKTKDATKLFIVGMCCKTIISSILHVICNIYCYELQS